MRNTLLCLLTLGPLLVLLALRVRHHPDHVQAEVSASCRKRLIEWFWLTQFNMLNILSGMSAVVLWIFGPEAFGKDVDAAEPHLLFWVCIWALVTVGSLAPIWSRPLRQRLPMFQKKPTLWLYWSAPWKVSRSKD